MHGKEILAVHNTADVLRILAETTPEERGAIGAAARARILAEHTSEHRARELERIVAGVVDGSFQNADADADMDRDTNSDSGAGTDRDSGTGTGTGLQNPTR